MLVVIPHPTTHPIRSAILRQFRDEVKDIILLDDIGIFRDSRDYERYKVKVEEKLKELDNSDEIALVLTGSYAACIIAYEELRRLGFRIKLLQYDAIGKRYQVIKP